MKILINYLKNFNSRSGGYILFASIAARILSFIASWIALQLISNKELGIVLFTYNVILFIAPFSGFGLHQSLLRYGALLKSKEEKNSLFRYTFFQGIKVTSAIILCIIFLSFTINFHFENTKYYLILLSLLLVPLYIFELVKIQFRLTYKNKLFASTDIIFSIILTISVLVFSYYFKELGYAISLITTPIIAVLCYTKKIKLYFKNYSKPIITNKSFWKYGIYSSLSNVVTQMLFVIDILLIGFLMNDAETVTSYKYVSLIPISLLFLPRAFINTDFVVFTENIYNKKYIIKYIKSYVLLFLIISIILGSLLIGFSKYILDFFDSSFRVYQDAFIILVIGVSGILILRGLFGNLLSSIGKAHVNFYITSIALLINITSNFYLIPKFGITGAAITSASLMWFTGLTSSIVFWQLYNKRFLSKK